MGWGGVLRAVPLAICAATKSYISSATVDCHGKHGSHETQSA